jgi:Flp pilus assembly protein TadG
MDIKNIKIFLKYRLLFRKINNQQGSAIVEFALVLPLLLLFLFGVIEFGLAIYNKQILTNAAREGARAGIVARSTRLPSAAIEATARNYAENHLITFGNKELIVNVTPSDTSGASFEDELTCQVEFDYEFLIISVLLPSAWETIPLSGTSVMIYE